jgi:excinuclease ABC subunit B
MPAREDDTTQALLQTWADVGQKGRAGGVAAGAGSAPVPRLGELAGGTDVVGMPSSDLAALIQDLTDQMRAAAAELQFELAARLRDEIGDLRKELNQMIEATK